MIDSPSSSGTLVDELRTILKDTAYANPQFRLRVSSSGGVSSALVEVQDGMFIVTVTGGSVNDAAFSLINDTDTIEKLVNALNALTGYTAEWVGEADASHPATDLQVIPPVTCLDIDVLFHTRRWSDTELTNMLSRAIGRHNSSVSSETSGWTGPYILSGVPKDQEYFILLLAQIEVMKSYVQDAVKRRGTDLRVEDYNTIKQSLEAEYASSLQLFVSRRQILTPEEEQDMGSGDITVGSSYRTSLRSGPSGLSGPRRVPYAVAPKPTRVLLSGTALGDGKVRLQWTRNRDIDFYKYELWRGTTRQVSNDHSETQVVRPQAAADETSTRVRIETQQDHLVWIDGELETIVPGTYYYVLYVINKNWEQAESPTIQVKVL